MPSPQNRVQVFPGQISGWYFHRRSRNGKVTAPSENYTRRYNAIKAARKLFPGDPIETVIRGKVVRLPS